MNLGMPEMIFIFLIALLIFGPRKLPEIGRQIGRFMSEFKRASNDFKYQIENEVRNLELEEQIKKDAELRNAEMQRNASQPPEAPGQAPMILPPEGTVPTDPYTQVSTEQQQPTSVSAPNPERQGETNA